ncbi:unnamed protein product [Adineta ricciae]|uniref:Cation-transporting P-type ATPase N-terminal domain-containing protein n=1 Tax=Adineta ricciae TaxID=249248 RepID=A0A813QWC1_ADIRI|nr:unnamed protein product [Adineta ricciae]CAF1216428.1 unnamed protein product [Adineta ricciae]
MSGFQMKTIPSTASGMDLLPGQSNERPRKKRSSNVPAQLPPERRQSSLNTIRRSIGIVPPEDNTNETIRKTSVAWQTMSQNLNLHLEQQRRKSELSSRRLQSIVATNQPSDHVTISIDEVEVVPSVTFKPHRPSDAGSMVDFDKEKLDDLSTLKTDVHVVPMETLVERFESNLESGLTDDTVRQHQSKYGQNKLTPPPKPSLIWMFFKQILVGFNGILWVATLFAFLSYKPFGDPDPDVTNLGLGVVLVLVIFSNGIFNFYQEVKSMKIVASFSHLQPTITTVKRNGMEMQINAEELVPGDIVRINMGQKVPADCRLITCDDLQVNTSELTGESEPVNCTVKCTNLNFMETTNLVFYPSMIVQGTANAIVVNIGDETVLGQVGKLTRGAEGSDITGLHREINRFVLFVICAALTSVILIWITWAAWLNVKQNGYITLNGNIVNSIGMVVAFIPEGLPAAVTLVLTIVAKRMYKQKVLVKSLATVETFNFVSVIATDKTGTLTMNQMTITALLWGKLGEYMVPIHRSEEETTTTTDEERVIDRKRPSLHPNAKSNALKDLLLGACLCNNAVFQSTSKTSEEDEDSNTETAEEENKLVGDAADVALYHLSQDKCSVDIEQVRRVNPRINVLPFNSKNKFMITANLLEQNLIKTPDENVLITLKGAPDFVLPRCTTYKQDDGDEELPMTDEFKQSIQQRQEALGKSGYRVIAMLQQRITKDQYDANINKYKKFKKQAQTASDEPDLNGLPGSNYCFIGMFSLLDPARPEVPDAVLKARRAQIRVAMVTGDHPTTAAAIAKKVNILSKEISLENGIDTFKIERNNQTGEISAHMMRDSKTLLGTHSIGELTTNIEVKGVSSAEEKKKKPSLFQRIRFYFSDPNQVKDVEKIPLIPYGVVVAGGDIHSMDDYMWDWVLSHQELVFARTSPEQKLRIVMEFTKRGEIVAVTGDGTNDAPALKQADLGVAMAAGTDVAREAGDMILLDNNFSSIIKAIETGRLLSDNLKKVAIYLLPGGSWSEVIPVFFNIWLGIPLSLSAFLAIIFCMLNDVVNALAMVSEKAERDIMSRPPAIRQKTHLLDWKLLFHAYLIVGNIECFSAFFCFFWYHSSKGISLNQIFFTYADYTNNPPANKTVDELTLIQQNGQCIYYVALCMMQFFNLLSSRTRYVSFFQHNPFYGKGKNLTVIFGILFSTCVGLVITLIPWLNHIFKTHPVPVRFVCPALGFGTALFLLDELRKYLVRRFPNSFLAKMAW